MFGPHETTVPGRRLRNMGFAAVVDLHSRAIAGRQRFGKRNRETVGIPANTQWLVARCRAVNVEIRIEVELD